MISSSPITPPAPLGLRRGTGPHPVVRPHPCPRRRGRAAGHRSATARRLVVVCHPLGFTALGARRFVPPSRCLSLARRGRRRQLPHARRFRTDHPAVVEQLLKQSVEVLRQPGRIDLDRIAQDGMRVCAAPGRPRFTAARPWSDSWRRPEPSSRSAAETGRECRPSREHTRGCGRVRLQVCWTCHLGRPPRSAMPRNCGAR